MLYDLVIKNRSYRGFDESRRLTREELLSLVECARNCPSSVNVQPLKYFIAYDKEVTDHLFPLTKWGRALPDMRLPHPGMAPTAFIVICQDLSIRDSDTAFFKDVGIVAQTILLAATEMELGGCMIGNFKPEEVKTALSLPDTIAPRLIVALGKPAETIVLTEVGADGATNYYRDENDVHYVPKRKLSDIVLE